MTYRILTEDTLRWNIKQAIRKKFDAFTLIPTMGYWKGHPERSLAIEIETTKEKDVYAVARDIKRKNKQQAVLVQRFVTASKLV